MFPYRQTSKAIMCMHVTLCEGPKEDRLMTTGLHTVADIYCNKCLQVVGWKYVSLNPKPRNPKP